MQLNKVSACLLCIGLLVSWPVVGEDEPKKPFELPTYAGDKPSIHAPDKPPKPGPIPDARDLYDRALHCWPAQTYMRAEVFVEGRARTESGSYLDSSGSVTTSGRTSAALVARIPLYSAAELDREREREFARRTKIADAVGELVASLADRHRMRRELEITRALERRSQERIRIGVAETAEQVRYLEKVASLESELLKQHGAIQKARLVLVGHCTAQAGDVLDRHLVQYIGSR